MTPLPKNAESGVALRTYKDLWF